MTIVFTSGELRAHSGGAKLYNLWVKLLRSNSYDACIATQDGDYARWLVHHEPVVSYAQVRQMDGPQIVTGWLGTPELDRLLQGRPLYYFDAELRWTLEFRPILERYLACNQIAGIATHSRYIQAWYMATYGITPALIREWSDMGTFYPDAQVRKPGTIGCMTGDPGLAAVFPGRVVPIAGDEARVAELMRSVDVFVGTNLGKHMLWGEGCPRTQQEAMHCGCAVVAYDVLGNREYLYDGWTGRMAEPDDREALVTTVQDLLADGAERERLRRNGTALVQALFSERGKIELARRWLQL